MKKMLLAGETDEAFDLVEVGDNGVQGVTDASFIFKKKKKKNFFKGYPWMPFSWNMPLELIDLRFGFSKSFVSCSIRTRILRT